MFQPSLREKGTSKVFGPWVETPTATINRRYATGLPFGGFYSHFCRMGRCTMASAAGAPLTFNASLSHSIVENSFTPGLNAWPEHAHHGDLGDHGGGLEALERLGTALAGREPFAVVKLAGPRGKVTGTGLQAAWSCTPRHLASPLSLTTPPTPQQSEQRMPFSPANNTPLPGTPVVRGESAPWPSSCGGPFPPSCHQSFTAGMSPRAAKSQQMSVAEG